MSEKEKKSYKRKLEIIEIIRGDSGKYGKKKDDLERRLPRITSNCFHVPEKNITG